MGPPSGQIARLLSAGRVIGSTGSPEKADRMVRGLGYDAVVLGDAELFAEQSAKATPDGVDALEEAPGPGNPNTMK